MPNTPSYFVSCGSQKDTTIKLWQISSNNSPDQIPITQLNTKKLCHNAFARSDNGLFTVATWTSQICAYNISKTNQFQKVSILSGHKSEVHCVAFSCDGKYLVSASLDQTIKLWNVGNDKKIGGEKLLNSYQQTTIPNAIAVEHLIDPRFTQQIQKKGSEKRIVIAVAVDQKITIFKAKYPEYKLVALDQIQNASYNKIKYLKFHISVESFNVNQKQSDQFIYLLASGFENRVNIFKVKI